MRQVEYWRWWLTSEVTGKRYRSRWHMSAEQAAGYPGAERVEGTMELRQVPDEGEHVPAPTFPLRGTGLS